MARTSTDKPRKKKVEVENLTEDDRNKLIQELDAVVKKYDKEIPKEEKEIYEIYRGDPKDGNSIYQEV